ncbi:MAG: GTP-binding protein [Anaerolineae bacterium]|nr:GTP-binding protein [Anaerolineae bacterium]
MNTSPTILIVDNDARVVEELARGLRQQTTCQVYTCTSGTDARAAIEQTHFDLVITDWRMADVDGVTLIREVKARSPDTITVLMSAYDMSEIQTLDDEFIAHHYLNKPFLMDDLLNIVQAVFAMPAAETAKDKPRVLKVVLGGDANVGKTSLIERYCTCQFDPQRDMTIGVDFHLYDVKIEQVPLRLVVWDLGGQERFAFARRVFYRGAQAVGLIFDVSNSTSFYNLMRWWRETREFLPDVPILLLANKIDLPRQVSREQAEEVARAWNVPFFESSCASGEGVAEFFHALAQYAWQHAQQQSQE